MPPIVTPRVLMVDTVVSGMKAPAPRERANSRDIGFAIGIVGILTILFLPIPAALIDIGLALSIALSVLILMYQFSYAEMVEDGAESARDLERRAVGRAVELLTAAKQKGRQSREAIEAIYYVRRLWTYLIEDLGKAENDLPETLRADLISIGLWVMREAEAIRRETSDNFDGLIEINSIIREGLR